MSMAFPPTSASTRDILSGYKVFSLPNLSTERVPKISTVRSSVQFRLDTDVPEITVLAALARCIGAYSEVDDVLLGLSTDNRDYAVRVQWGRGQSWNQVVQDVLVEEISEVEVRRRLTLNDENQHPYGAFLSRTETTRHPIHFILSENQLFLHLSSTYFHESTASILADQIQALTTHATLHGEESCDDCSFLPAHLLSSHDTTLYSSESSYSHTESVSNVTDYIRNGAERHPLWCALEYHHALSDPQNHRIYRLTYQDLHHDSNRFAHFLIARGVQRGDRVALSMPRNIEFHIGLLGIMKAGACYVSIDPELPLERKSFIVEDSKPRFVFTEESVTAEFEEAKSCLSDDICLARPEDLAYLLYTSGTTGLPKGCLLTHRGLSHAILALSSYALQGGADDGRYLAVASIAFDVHLAEIFVALTLGMTLVTAPRNELFENLPYWLRDLGITHVGIVPSLIEATMSAVDESTGEEENEMKLRYIASGGEKISDTILDRWANHPQVKLANFYGPSEVTIGCAARFMSYNTKRENIGRIFSGCGAYIVDRDLKVVMKGSPGELLVIGPLVGKGYHGRPDLTAKAFINWNGQWSYRTGDLVRMMPDDTLEILGRIDSQIKLNGVRIESEGISYTLRKAASSYKPKLELNAATILARHPAMQNDQLVSFIVQDRHTDIYTRRSQRPLLSPIMVSGLVAFLREECRKALPSYMIPTHIVPLNFIPLSSNGKVDEKMLKSIFREISLETLIHLTSDEGLANGSDQSRELSQTEKELALIVSTQLGSASATQLTPFVNLMSLGYDSLKLVHLASRIRENFFNLSKSISVSDLMLAPTIEHIASLINVQQSGGTKQEFDSMTQIQSFSSKWQDSITKEYDAERVECVLPTFPLQDGVLYRSMEYNTLYIEHVTLRCAEGVALEKVHYAWQEAMARFEILRTVFSFQEETIQVVLRQDACCLPWSEHEISGMASCDFLTWFRSVQGDRISKDIVKSISTIPPFRLNAFVASDRQFVVLSIHHSIYDGISLPILLQAVDKLYTGDIFIQSCTISEALAYVYSVDLEKAKNFWVKYMENYDWARNSFRSIKPKELERMAVPLDMSLSELYRITAECHCTAQALLTASYAIALGFYVYQSQDIVFGTIRSGRSSVNQRVNDTTCPLLSVQPIRTFTGTPQTLLPTLQKDIANLLEFEHVPLTKIKHWVIPPGELFETIFSLSIKPSYESNVWNVIDAVQPNSDYVLAVEIVLDEVSGTVVATSLFDAESIQSKTVSTLLHSLQSIAYHLATKDHSRLLGPVAGDFKFISQPTRNNQESEIIADSSSNASAPPAVMDVDMEKRMSETITKFLHVKSDIITPTVSLLSLGLDSIKAMGLSQALRKASFNLTAVDLMKRPTIRQIVNHILLSTHSATYRDNNDLESSLLKEAQLSLADHMDTSALKLDNHDEVTVYPTTELQSGMLTQTVTSCGQLYLHAFLYRLSPVTDLMRLKEAWFSAIKVIAILRTSFYFIPDLGSWSQIVHSSPPPAWTESEMRDSENLLDYAARILCSFNLRREDDFKLPPVRIEPILSKSTGDRYILLILHHALYDGISIGKLLDLVTDIYNEGPKLLTETPQFHDFLGYFRRQELYGASYWVKYLENYRFPHNKIHVDIQKVASHVLKRTIHIDSAQLNNRCKELRVTAQCFGQVAWAVSLANFIRADDIVFGHVVSGRQIPSSEDVLGPMLSSIPCRVIFSPGIRNDHLLQEVHNNNIAALDWLHSSLRSLQKNFGEPSIWFSLFLFQPSAGIDTQDSNEIFHPIELNVEDVKTQYPISVELHQQSECLFVKAACQSGFLEPAEFQALIDDFCSNFKYLVEEPHTDAHLDTSFSIKWPSTNLPTINNALSEKERKPVDWPPEDLTFTDLLASIVNIPSIKLSPNTPLLSLGIDSVSAIQISSRCRKHGFKLNAADILRCNMISDVLNLLKGSKINSKEGFVSPLENYNSSNKIRNSVSSSERQNQHFVESVLPVTAGMKWLIGAWRHSHGLRYHNAFAFRLPNGVDDTKLRQAWKSLVCRHSILRTSFTCSEKEPLRIVVFQNESVPDHMYTTIDFDGKSLTESDASGFMKCIVSSPRPLIQTEPITKVFLLRVGAESKVLVLSLHHFQYDAWSLNLLMEDFEDLYYGRQPASNHDLPEYVTWATGASLSLEQENYWKSHFPQPNYPSYFPRISHTVNDESHREYITVSGVLEDIAGLRANALASGVTLDFVFLASWASVQASYTKDPNVTFNLWHLGRSGGPSNTASLGIPCVNILPVYVRLEAQMSLLEIAHMIQTILRERSPTIEQSDLEKIDQWIGGDGIPLCNVLINIVKMNPDQKASGNLFSPLDAPYFIPDSGSDFTNIPESFGNPRIASLVKDDLVIDIVASTRGTIDVTVEYERILMTRDQAEHLVTQWSEKIREMMPNISIS